MRLWLSNVLFYIGLTLNMWSCLLINHQKGFDLAKAHREKIWRRKY